MQFEYSVYMNNLLVLPVSIIAFAVPAVICVVKAAAKKGENKNDKLGRFAAIIIVAICLSPLLLTLARGGICMLAEDSSDAVHCVGIIQSVVEPSERYPGFKTSHSRGADIIVEDLCYFAVTAGNFKVGDYVYISYLPGSMVILEIQEVSE